ncbi:MAG: Ig-like domain-containing protein [Eubacteriales bacterium]|nr:Ig-like domain-containing protein [Eubacteriales bacterium]
MIRYRRIGCILLAGVVLGGALVYAAPEQMARAAEQIMQEEKGTPVLGLLPDQPVAYTLKVKETVQLTAQDVQQDGDTEISSGSGSPADNSIRWASDNEAVATVDKNGLVTAVAKGQTAIYGACADGSILTCKLTVSGDAVTGITLDKKVVSMIPGEQTVIRAAVQPAQSGATVTWWSDNTAVASVDDTGRVTAVKVGTAVITASADGITASCTVNVTETAQRPEQPTGPSNENSDNKTNGTNGTNGTTGTNSTTKYPFYSGATGAGGVLYMPGSTIPSTAIRTYEMPKNIPSASFLTIESDMGANTTAALTQLKQYGVSATFFVPVGDLYTADNLLRQIAGEGHTIGLLLTPEQAKDPAAAVSLMNAANEQLSVITGTPSRIVRVQSGSAGSMTTDGLAVLQAGGYCLWDWNSAPGSYDAAVRALNTTGSVTLRLDNSATTATTLQQLLPYMRYCGIPAKSLSTGDTPVCQLS